MNIKEKNCGLKKFTLFVIVLGLFAILTYLFYMQSLKLNNGYRSDLPAHIVFAQTGRGYSALYQFMGFVYNFGKGTWAIAVLESLIVVLTILLSGRLLKMLAPSLNYVEATLISLPISFLTGMYIPGIYEHYYIQQLVTQPYHNITYYGMRLFAVCVFIAFFEIFEGYLEKIKWKYWVGTAIFLLLSTSVKPNFLLGFSFTLLLFLIVDFLKYRFEKKPFIQMILMGGVVFPSLFMLLWQANMLYGTSTAGSSSGIGLIWGATFVRYGFVSTLLKLICSLSFPIIVFLVNRKKLNRNSKFIYLMFLVQLLVCILFTEVGEREAAYNFYWGLYGAGFFLFIDAVAVFVKNWKEKLPKWYKIVGIVLLLIHLISSILYFVHIVLGGNFDV